MGRVICAWCEKEGKTETMDMGEAKTDANTHSICEQHQQELLREIAQLKQRRPTANPRKKRR